jgi:pilus assembly protein CpaB
MNRNRMLILGIVALILSTLVTFYIYKLLQRRLQPSESTTQIVVAAKKLPLGTRITEADLQLASWPKSVALEGSYADRTLVIGRGVTMTIFPNEPIVESKLAPKEGGSGLPSVIPDGMRAVSVKVNDVIGVAGFVLPGTHVDVIMTGTPKGVDDTAAKIFLENVQVLAAGQNVEQDANGKPQNVQVVTLLTTPEQAQELALAGTEGTIRLALRNPLDSEKKETSATQMSSLFTGSGGAPLKPAIKPAATKAKVQRKAAPVVTPPPPPPPKVEVQLFLGRNKEVLTFIEAETEAKTEEVVK